MRIGSRLLFWFTVTWLSFTTVLFAVITVLIYRTPEFPLGLGWLQTRGQSRLLVTIPNLALGVAGLTLLFLSRRSAAWLILAYSVFWAANFTWAVGSILPTVIRHPVVVCSSGTCNSLPVAFVVILGFVASGTWSLLQTFPKLVRA